MSVESQALAGVKNRVGRWQLASELHRIEREEKAEMRMHNTAKQRFKAKYYKLENFIDRGKDASDVRMYETHNPGFCFRRNGECRTPQTTSPSPSVDYDDIYCLLFTEGELDIEKVLCLHLLTAHKTETLTPPPKTTSHSFIAKNQTPLERLIERSRKKRQEDSVTKLLPTYILEVITNKSGDKVKKGNDFVIRDGRLAARVIINDKIVQLVHIVLAALQNTNPAKMNSLLEMASNVETIKEILEKPYILEFLGTLNGHTLICSCESFHLTPPFKAVTIPLELEITTNTVLAKLLQYIRKTVLQSPTQTIKHALEKLKPMKEESQSNEDTATLKSSNKPKDTLTLNSKTSSSEHTDLQSSLPTKSYQKNNDSNLILESSSRGSKATTSKKKVDNKTSGTSKNNIITGSAFPSFLSYLEEDQRSKRTQQSSFKSKTSEKLANSESNKKETADKQNDPDLFRRLDIQAVADLLNNKAQSANKRDLKTLKESKENSEEPKLPPKPQQENVKVSIKQTKCHACLNKWRFPLPEPKIPKIKKGADSEQSFADYKSGSAQRISSMIDEEMKKLNAERRAPNLSRYPVQDFKKKGNSPGKQMVDTVDMDALDLAKITQEIKEKETQKKMLNFLSNKM